MARCGSAQHILAGKAGNGWVGTGSAKIGRRGEARCVEVWHGAVWLGWVRQARCVEVGQAGNGLAGTGSDKIGRLGEARQGKVRSGSAGIFNKEKT